MNQFSISQLAHFSGIKPHTIRIWEQRYQALNPQRTEGNTRFYDGQQLRRLLNIVSLTKTKYKVSQLCSMSDEDLYKLVKEQNAEAGQKNDYDYFVNQLISAGMNYDVYSFEKAFSDSLSKLGMEKTYIEVINPMLKRIGILWSSNSIPPSQEHYISHLLKQKMFAAIDSLPNQKENEETWLLFLPEDEFHELGLLFSNYLIRSKGKNVVYLGPSMPLSSIQDVLSGTKIDKLLLFVVHKNLPENVGEYLANLVGLSKGKSIFVAADKELSEKLPAAGPFNWLHSVKDLEDVFLDEENLKPVK